MIYQNYRYARKGDLNEVAYFGPSVHSFFIRTIFLPKEKLALSIFFGKIRTMVLVTNRNDSNLVLILAFGSYEIIK